jgi:hypothetical protein
MTRRRKSDTVARRASEGVPRKTRPRWRVGLLCPAKTRRSIHEIARNQCQNIVVKAQLIVETS